MGVPSACSLADLASNRRVFDSVIVVTDRVVLDQQLQDTIYQFEHKRGVVQRIDESSRQLAEALENAVPVIITKLQKFPFVSRQLLKIAEERGTPNNRKRINWKLITDLPVQSRKDAIEKLEWYSLRWKIEVFVAPACDQT